MQTNNLQTVFGQTLVANAVSLTTATSANILAAPIVCSAGTWIFLPVVNFIWAATTSYTVAQFGINTTSATLPTSDTGLWKQTVVALVPAAAQSFQGCAYSLTFATTTNVYLVAQATFTVSTTTASGYVTAIQTAP